MGKQPDPWVITAQVLEGNWIPWKGHCASENMFFQLIQAKGIFFEFQATRLDKNHYKIYSLKNGPSWLKFTLVSCLFHGKKNDEEFYAEGDQVGPLS